MFFSLYSAKEGQELCYSLKDTESKTIYVDVNEISALLKYGLFSKLKAVVCIHDKETQKSEKFESEYLNLLVSEYPKLNEFIQKYHPEDVL